MSDADETADLRKRVEELEKALAPPKVPSMASDAAWRDEMRAISEKRMNHAHNFLTKEDYRAMEAACSTSAVKDIVSKGGGVPAPQGMIPTTSQIGAVHTSPGLPGTQGWVALRPLGPSGRCGL